MKTSESTVLVTGANRGIGRAIVEAYVSAGAKKVYAAARKLSDLESLVATNQEKIVPVELDVTNVNQIEAAAKTAGDINVLINNAGAATWGPITEFKSLADDINFQINFLGTVNVTNAFAPVLKANGGGAVANLLSVVSLGNMPIGAAYSISKAALWSATQAFRATLAKDGIKVFGVFPGPIDTDMAKGIDLPKTAPNEVALAIIHGIENGEEDIFPDPMAKQVQGAWNSNPKSVEQMFAGMAG
jgi:NAD(P)-dependent dehydrogenase (short-subunit alcohol dehydrogenase family)